MSANGTGLLTNAMTDVYSNSPPTPPPPSPYRLTLTSKEAELRKLKGELQENKINVSYLESDLKAKEAILEKKDLSITKMQKELIRLRNVQQEVESLKHFQEKSLEQEEELKKLKAKIKELASLNTTVLHLEEENSVLINDNDILKTKIKHLENVASRDFNLNQDVEEQKLKIATLEEELALKVHLLNETEKMKDDSNQHLNQIHAMYREKIDFLEERLAQADVSGEILSEACVELQIQELQFEMAELKNSKDKKIGELQDEIIQTQCENERLNAEMKRTEADYQSNLCRTNERWKETKDELEAVNLDKQNLESTLHVERENNSRMRKEQTKTIADMESTFKMYQTETDHIKKKFQDTLKTFQITSEERDDLRQEIDRVKKEYQMSKSKTKEKIEELQEKLSNISINKCSIVRHLSLLLEQHKIVKEQMQNQQNEIDKQSTAFEIYLEHLSKNVSTLESEKTEYDRSFSQLEQTAATLIATLKKKQEEIATLQTKLHKTQREKDELLENANHLKNDIAEMEIFLESSTNKANEREKNLQNTLESRLQEIEVLKTKSKIMSKEKKDWEKKLQVMTYEKSKMSAEIESKQDDLEMMRTEMRKLVKLREKYKSECLSLEKVIKEKDEDLSQLDRALAIYEENTKNIVNYFYDQLSNLAEVNFELGSKLIILEESSCNRILQLENVLAEKIAKCEKLRDSNLKSEQTSEEMRRKTSCLSSEIQQLQQKMATAVQSHEELKVTYNDCLVQIQKKDSEIVKLTNSFTRLSELLDCVIKKSEFFRDQLETEVNELNESLKSTKIRLENALKDVERLNDGNASLEEIVKKSESESKQLRLELQATGHRLTENENSNSTLISNLVGENEMLKKEIEEKTVKINELELQTREMLESTGIRLNAALEDSERLRTENKMLEDKLREAGSEISQLKTESIIIGEKMVENETKSTELISTLISEKDLQRKEIENWTKKASDIESEMNESLRMSEIQLNSLRVEIEQIRETNATSDITLKRAKDETSNLQTELDSTRLLLKESEKSYCSMSADFDSLKELKQKENDEWVKRMSTIKTEMDELREEDSSLRRELKQMEDKETKLIIENGRLVREQHSLGMNHELELAEKLGYFRNLWETDKSALQLRLECKNKELEELKSSFNERLKQEALKCVLLQKEVASLQAKNAKAEEMLASNAENQHTVEELKQKVDLYRRHYEVHMKKSNELSEALLRERNNASELQTKIDELNNLNQTLQRRFVEITNNLKLKPYDIYSSTVSLANLSPTIGGNATKSRTSSMHDSNDREVLTSSKLSLKSNEKFDDSLDDFNVSPFSLRSSTKHLAASVNTLAEVGGDRFTSEKNWLSSENENMLFDNKYLSNLKDGTCDLEFGRLTELQRRNTLCQPHLKTSYPIEMQMCTTDDNELKRQRKQSLESVTAGAHAISIKSPPKRKSEIPKNTSFNIGFSPKRLVRRRLIKSPKSKLIETRFQASKQSTNKLKIFSKPFGHRGSKNDLLL